MHAGIHGRTGTHTHTHKKKNTGSVQRTEGETENGDNIAVDRDSELNRSRDRTTDRYVDR